MMRVLGSGLGRFIPAIASVAPFMPCCYNFATGANLPMPCCWVGNGLMLCCQRFFN
jgi:hypothetical protein